MCDLVEVYAVLNGFQNQSKMGDAMYDKNENKRIKEEFIEEYVSNKQGDEVIKEFTRNRLNNLFFNKVNVSEEMYQKDASTFTKSEIMQMLMRIQSVSVSTLRGYKTFLTQYTYWATDKGINSTGINMYEEITTDDLASCVPRQVSANRIISEERLDEMLHEMMNPSDQYVILGLYEGIRGENFCELLNLHEEDINVHDKTFYLRDTGRTIHVSARLINYALAAINTYDYDGCAVEGGKIVHANLDRSDDTPIKGRVSSLGNDETKRVLRVTRRVRKLKKYFDNATEISVPRLYVAGFVNKTKAIMQEKNVSFDDVWTFAEMEALYEQYSVDYKNIPYTQIKTRYREYFA